MKLWKTALPVLLSTCFLFGCVGGSSESDVSGGSLANSATNSTNSTATGSGGTASESVPMEHVGTKEVEFNVEQPANIDTYGNSTVEGIGFDTDIFDDINTVYYVDMNSLVQAAGGVGSVQAYEEMKFIVAVQGLVNRVRPMLFIEQISTNESSVIKDEANFEVDSFWFDWLKTKNYMGNDKENYEEIRIESFDQFLEQKPLVEFIKQQGYVVWDREVPATSNVASTVCGIDGYLPVLGGGTVIDKIKALGAKEKMDLTGRFTAEGTIWQTSRSTTGSKKNDAYIWALEKYGDKVNSNKVGYLCDSYAMDPVSDQAKALLQNGYNYATNQVCSQDYFILNKCFIFDLSCFTDAIPLDDTGYGRTATDTDYNTFKEILLKLYNRNEGSIGTVTGFTPWSIKYTAHTGERPEIGGLDGETTFVALCNAYNFVVDADAPGMGTLSNASFYVHVELADGYENPKPTETVEYDPAKKYVFIYMGDYDGASWTDRFVAKYYKTVDEQYLAAADKKFDLRGDDMVTWAFNPNLSQRVPQAFLYMMENRTNKDYFICGDTGAGYVFPDVFREDNATRKAISGLPDGMEALQKWNEYFYGKFGIDTTGFLLSHDVRINGQGISNQVTTEVMEMFASFSPGGIMLNRFPEIGWTEEVWTKRRGRYSMDVTFGDQMIPCTVLQGDLTGGITNVANNAKAILNKLDASGAADKLITFRSILISPRDIGYIKMNVLKQRDDVVFVDAYNFFEIYKQAYK